MPQASVRSWTQDDFKQFEAFFTRVTFARNGSDRKAYDKMVADLGLDPKKLNGNKLREEIAKAAKEGKLIPVPDLYVQAPKYNKNANAKKKDNGKKNTVADSPKAKLLGGDVVDIDQLEDPRGPLMEWLKSNPLFARAFVNRVWANYFNRGIVEPTDDMNLANPPSNEALLDHLAKGFVASGYDMKWVHREICAAIPISGPGDRTTRIVWMSGTSAGQCRVACPPSRRSTPFIWPRPAPAMSGTSIPK